MQVNLVAEGGIPDEVEGVAGGGGIPDGVAGGATTVELFCIEWVAMKCCR